MRGSVRYTTEDLVLFARGGSILEFGAEQYRDLCKMLIGRPEFAGADYSWGDRVINATAKSALRPAGEPRWRAAGTSHHLQLVTAIAGISAVALENARRLQWLEAENQRLATEMDFEHSMVGESAPMRAVYRFISRVAPTDSTVLITGESGTG